MFYLVFLFSAAFTAFTVLTVCLSHVLRVRFYNKKIKKINKLQTADATK